MSFISKELEEPKLEVLDACGKEAPTFQLCVCERRLTGPGQKSIPLTRMEIRLLAYLADQCGRVISKLELLQKVWGYSPRTATHTVETHIWRLRRKLGRAFSEIEVIRTVEGGYSIGCVLIVVGVEAQAKIHL